MEGVCKNELLSTKRAVFMDKDYKSRDLSTKKAIFMDSKRLCTEVARDLVRGTNCPRHGITQKSLPGSHSGYTDFPEDRARFPHHEIFDRSRSCKKDQELPSKKHPESPKSSPQYIRCAAIGLCCELFCVALHS